MNKKEIKFKFLKNIYSNKFVNFLYLNLFILSYYLYYLSLEKCLEGIARCSLKLHWINVKLAEAILSSIILSVLIEFIFFKIISKLHFIHIIIFLIISYQFSNGKDFDNHGFFNFFGVILSFFLKESFFLYLIEFFSI